MTIKLQSTTRHFCIYCKNELLSDQEIKFQAHQKCLDEIKLFKGEHDITKYFNEPDAKFLLVIYYLHGLPF